ncbi:MAG: beta-phosphoglucomutase [Flavobacteriaceae bacterium]
MTTKGFIFDLDGVIVDTAKYHFMAWNDLANSLGIAFSEAQNEQLKGVSRVDSLKKILDWGNITLTDQEFASRMTSKNQEYLSYIEQMNESEILPGVLNALLYIQSKGHLIGLGSASKNARLILEKVGLISHFDCIIDGTDVTRAKPDPEVFLKAAGALRLNPDHCIVFEDAAAGVQAANAANMISIGIGNEEFLFEADLVLSGMKEIDESMIDTLVWSNSKSEFKKHKQLFK